MHWHTFKEQITKGKEGWLKIGGKWKTSNASACIGCYEELSAEKALLSVGTKGPTAYVCWQCDQASCQASGKSAYCVQCCPQPAGLKKYGEAGHNFPELLLARQLLQMAKWGHARLSEDSPAALCDLDTIELVGIMARLRPA
jgi:hypothetical protein